MQQPDLTRTEPPQREREKLSFGYICLLCFIFSIIVNPARLLPPLAVLRLQDFFAILAIIGFVMKMASGTGRLRLTMVEGSYVAFILVTGLGFFTLYAYGLQHEGFLQYQTSLKTLAVLLLIGFYSATFTMFRKGFNVFMLAVALFELHSIRAVINGVGMHAGRFDSWVGLITNSDAIGAFLVMMLPIQLELYLYYTGIWKRYGMLVLALFNLTLMVLTQTRSAFLSFVIVFPLWLLRKGERAKRFFIAVVLVATMVFAGMYMSLSTEYETYFDRMASIFATETHAEDANIMSRFLFWQQGWEIWRSFPLLGCGIGGMDPHETLTDSTQGQQYTEGMSLSEYSLHQSYIQVLAERGLLGGVTYLVFLWSLLRVNRKSIVYLQEKEHGYHYFVARGMQLSLYAFLVNAMFMTITESWMLIIVAGFVAGLYKSCRNEQQAENNLPADSG